MIKENEKLVLKTYTHFIKLAMELKRTQDDFVKLLEAVDKEIKELKEARGE